MCEIGSCLKTCEMKRCKTEMVCSSQERKVRQQSLIKMKVSDEIKVLMYTWNIFTGKLFMSFWKVRDWKKKYSKIYLDYSKTSLYQ